MANSNPVLGYVPCPKCGEEMEVKATRKGSNRTPKKLGYCQHCRNMMQGNAHQDYLSSYAEQAAHAPAVPVVEKVEPVAKGGEDWTPEKTPEPVQQREPVSTPKKGKAGVFVLVALGVGLSLLGLGAVVKQA